MFISQWLCSYRLLMRYQIIMLTSIEHSTYIYGFIIRVIKVYVQYFIASAHLLLLQLALRHGNIIPLHTHYAEFISQLVIYTRGDDTIRIQCAVYCSVDNGTMPWHVKLTCLPSVAPITILANIAPNSCDYIKNNDIFSILKSIQTGRN